MERLKFDLPEFMRVAWVSPAATSAWKPRIQRASRAWEKIEKLAILDKVKPMTLQAILPQELGKVCQWAIHNGLVALPLNQQGMGDGYSASTKAYDPKYPWTYRVVIGKSSHLSSFVKAWQERNDEVIGTLLGYPSCCRKFFAKYWGDGWKDTTYPMVGLEGHLFDVSGPMECNILLRWIGIRAVSHLPCSFNCGDSAKIGASILEFGQSVGFVDEVETIRELLSWPIQWDSSHGAAIITTPCFRIVADSTPLSQRVIIRRDSNVYPEEGARGLEFPFRNTHKVVFLKDTWTANGFKDKASMDRAHEIILASIRPGLGGKVLDLGCGNGILLEKILKRYPHFAPCGVEMIEERYQSAARRLIQHDPDIRLGDVFDVSLWDGHYGLSLVAEQRLKEAAQIADFERALKMRCEHVLVYDYETMSTRYL